MFRFSIRELMLVTLVAAMGVGWWLDHRAQGTVARYYKDHYRYWRERVNLLDNMLTEQGYEIKRDDFSTTYIPPIALRSKLPGYSPPATMLP